MADDWLILHAGALGDLLLTLQLALRLPGVAESEGVRVVSRTDPGDLSACRPSIVRRSSEGLGLHWLFGDQAEPPPERLRALIGGARVLSALGGAHTITHHRLDALAPAALYSIDPRPRDGVDRHVTQQWQTQLEEQGLLVPKCVHQRPAQRGLGVPEELRARGRQLLAECVARAGANTASASDPLAAARGSDGTRVLVHPGSGGASKCWPLACFVNVARRLSKANVGVFFLVGPVELERWDDTQLAVLADEFPILRSPSPDELVAVIAGATALIGNDAGPSHLAALLGARTVVIFGPTASSVWRPLGADVRVLSGDARAAAGDWGLAPAAVVKALGLP